VACFHLQQEADANSSSFVCGVTPTNKGGFAFFARILSSKSAI
jgi:hypothetical protein